MIRVTTAAKGRPAVRSAKGAPTPVKVTFALPVSEVPEAVSVCGDFNGWDPLAHPLKRRANGTRSVSVELAPGRYAFKYLTASGTWLADPDAHGHEPNEYGETNSILELA